MIYKHCMYCHKKYNVKEYYDFFQLTTTCKKHNNYCSYERLINSKKTILTNIIIRKKRNEMIKKLILREKRMITAFLCLKNNDISSKINKTIIRLIIDERFLKKNKGVYSHILDINTENEPDIIRFLYIRHIFGDKVARMILKN